MCGTHYEEGVTCANPDINAEAACHVEDDALTPEKEQIEAYEDYDGKSYGTDRYRTEAMYDSLDNLDRSLKLLVERRAYQTSRL